MLNPLFDRYYERDSQKSKEVLNKENKDVRSELEGNNKRPGWKSDSVSLPLKPASSTVVDKELKDLDWDKQSQCIDKSLRKLYDKELLDDDEWERRIASQKHFKSPQKKISGAKTWVQMGTRVMRLLVKSLPNTELK